MTLETRTTDASAKSVQGFARAGSIRALGAHKAEDKGPEKALSALSEKAIWLIQENSA